MPTSKALALFEPSTEISTLVENAEIHLGQARSYTINSVVTYKAVDSYIADVISDLKKIESYKELAIRDLKDSLDERTTYFNPVINTLKSAKKDLQSKQQKWNKRQEEVAAAAQREADAAAAKLAADEIARVTKENEGQSAEVLSEALQEAAEQEIAAPMILVATPEGRTKYRDKWEVEVTDALEAIKYIAANGSPGMPSILDYVQFNFSHLNKVAGSIKKEGELIPGLKIVNKRIAVS